MLFFTVFIIVFIGFTFWISVDTAFDYYENWDNPDMCDWLCCGWSCIIPMILFYILFAAIIYFVSPIVYFNLRSYTHFPRRFNRKNRQVYIFNTNGSVTKLPFDEIYWHIGHGLQDKDYIDLRGHQLDENGIIRYAFNVGKFNEEPDDLNQCRIRGLFDYICAYMNHGEKGIAENMYDKLVLVKFDGQTWNDSWVFNMGRYKYNPIPGAWSIAMPLCTCFHYICMKLSKVPKWPEWVEKECEIDPNDFIWRDPEQYDGFSGEMNEEEARGDFSFRRHLAKRMKLPGSDSFWAEIRKDEDKFRR